MGELCLASGGHLTNCSAHSTCGINTAECTTVVALSQATACDCGPAMRFEEGAGCVPDDSCGTGFELHAAVCAFSGHTMTAECEPTHCGNRSPLFCAAPACECGDHEVFDPHRGCVWSPECRVRMNGQACGEDIGDCADGLACCGGTCVASCYPACGASCDGFTGCEVDR